MQTAVYDRLMGYISQHYPEILDGMDESQAKDALQWVIDIAGRHADRIREGTPAYIADQLCVAELVEGLGPSRFQYVSLVFQEEFEAVCQELEQNGTLHYELLNMIKACQPVFDALGFSEAREDDRTLRYAIAGTIREYLKGD